MSVKIIAELHPFKTERIKVSSNPKPISEIITDLNSGFPLSHARVCKNGEIIKDFSVMAHNGDTLWIKFVPYGDNRSAGIGMKVGGHVLTAAGILIAAFAGWTGIGAFVGAALVGTGISMMLGGTVLLNTKIPSLEDYEKPENDPSIRGAKNQSRPHGRIPVLFGRHRVYPDLAANQYTEIKDNQQYFTQLFCGGYKDCEIDLDSFKLGDTPLIDLSQTKDINQILAGNDPVIRLEILQSGEESKIYPKCVHEEVLNAPLQNRIDDGNGNKISGEIIRVTPDNTDAINVDIFLHNGIGKYDDKGKLGNWSIEVWVSYKKDDDPYSLLSAFEINGSDLKTIRRHATISGLTPGKYTVKIERRNPDSTDSKVVDAVHVGSIRSFKSERPIRAQRQGELTIIAMRVMATSKLNNVIDSFNYVATSKLPVYSGTGSGPLYWLNSTKTRNPASMLLYALRGRAAQQQIDDADIDWPSIEKFYLWCEEHKYTCNAYLSQSVTIAEMIRMIGSTARADILRIDSKISVVQDIERPSHMQLFTPKNTISYSTTMFNADVPDAIALRFIDEKAGFAHNESLVYNTPDGNKIKEPDTIQKADLWGITDDEQARRIGMYSYGCIKNRPFVHTIEADIEYLLVNKGDWIQYAGDIALTGSAQGRIKGIIWVDGVCVGIDTDEPIVMTEGQQNAVRIRLSNGTIILKEVVFNPTLRREKAFTYYPSGNNEELYEPFVGDMYAVDENNVYYEPQNTILFTEPLAANNAPKAGDIYAFGIRGYEALDLIITDIQPGADLTATLICVEYSPEIFGVDEDGFILPDFVNRITPVSGAVDHGVVNTNNWRHFAVFHDSEEEPPRPAGNGQSGEWYQEQTFRSIWQSTKIAESIDSGEWSLPVRIKAQRGTDDITPVWLALTPQNIILETDGDGNVLVGLLPSIVQARLLMWNSVLQGVTFSLSGAPQGVSIDASGRITISASAALGDNTDVTVNASYQGAVYTSVLNIKKNIRNSPAKYLGTVSNLTLTNSSIFIINGPVLGQVRALQGDYVLAVAAISGRQAGSVFQWTGINWEFRSPDTHADLYIRSFKDGLDVPGLADNTEWFGAVITRQLVALRAFIEEFESQFMLLKKGGVFHSENYKSGVDGFRMDADGNAEFNSVIARGRIEATEGFIKNITAINLTTDGTLNNVPMAGYARVHPAADTTSATDADYPVGTILLGRKARSDQILPLNSFTQVYIGSSTTTHIVLVGDVSGISQAPTRLPGNWRISGGTGITPFAVLVRRVS